MLYPGTEYIVKLDPEFSPFYGNLSVHACPECFALVPEDQTNDHLEWHRKLTIGDAA